jgi:Domain of unknown function (DUF4149)
MKTFLHHRLPLFAAALWWGSLTTLGFVVVPLLFAHLPTLAIAGGTAAKLFNAQTWLSAGCAVLLLIVMQARLRAQHEQIDDAPFAANASATSGAMVTSFLVASGLLLALLVEFGIAPRIVARDNVKLWHAVSSMLYLLQWGCAGAILWRLGSPQREISEKLA